MAVVHRPGAPARRRRPHRRRVPAAPVAPGRRRLHPGLEPRRARRPGHVPQHRQPQRPHPVPVGGRGVPRPAGTRPAPPRAEPAFPQPRPGPPDRPARPDRARRAAPGRPARRSCRSPGLGERHGAAHAQRGVLRRCAARPAARGVPASAPAAGAGADAAPPDAVPPPRRGDRPGPGRPAAGHAGTRTGRAGRCGRRDPGRAGRRVRHHGAHPGLGAVAPGRRTRVVPPGGAAAGHGRGAAPLSGGLAGQPDHRPRGHRDRRADPGGHAGAVLPFLTHRDPRLWPDPLAFKPDRFDEGRPAWGFLPFSAGRRTCLGAHLARAMLHAALTPWFTGKITQVDGDPRPAAAIALRPSGPLWIERHP
ncbi:cytochrome P450 [Catellatospora bangladeshensis]|uniref:cytochrome P450 n=1 Tax=Catellatospora bangladeshensis TaxID=310355 RepID=UPI0036092198